MSAKRLITSVFAAAIAAASIANAGAAPIQQWASSVVGFSSEWSSTSWSAAQALGAPDTFAYGDIATAWTSKSSNGTLEWISVGFDTAVYANGATVRETSGNGFVYQIDAIDTLGKLHKVWDGIDTSAANVPFDFSVSWNTTSFLVAGLKVYVDTNSTTTWEEIDAIRLSGDSVAPVEEVPEPASLALMGLGLGLAGLARRRRAA